MSSTYSDDLQIPETSFLAFVLLTELFCPAYSNTLDIIYMICRTALDSQSVVKDIFKQITLPNMLLGGFLYYPCHTHQITFEG